VDDLSITLCMSLLAAEISVQPLRRGRRAAVKAEIAGSDSRLAKHLALMDCCFPIGQASAGKLDSH